MAFTIKKFNASADRLANVWTLNDIGSVLAVDLQNGSAYMVVQVGSGVATMAAIANNQNMYEVSLSALRLTDGSGNVGNTVANGGVLASDTVPILRAATNVTWEISWATGNVQALCAQIPIKPDMDLAQDINVELDVYSGTTDKASFTVGISFDGATQLTATADDTSTKSATVHTITANFPLANNPASAKRGTIMLTPATAHATNAYQLQCVRVRYTRK